MDKQEKVNFQAGPEPEQSNGLGDLPPLILPVLFFLAAIISLVIPRTQMGRTFTFYLSAGFLFTFLGVYFKYAPKDDDSRAEGYMFQAGPEEYKTGIPQVTAWTKAMKDMDEKRGNAYKKIIFDGIIAFLICILVSIPVQMTLKENWLLCAIISLVVAAFAAYANNESGIEVIAGSEQICDKCGSVNRKDTYYCAKCGHAMEKNLERFVRVYLGFESAALIVMQALRDRGIITWKNRYYYSNAYMPVYVYVFEEDAKEAGDIVEMIFGNEGA